MFGVPNAKYLAFDTPDESALSPFKLKGRKKSKIKLAFWHLAHLMGVLLVHLN